MSSYWRSRYVISAAKSRSDWTRSEVLRADAMYTPLTLAALNGRARKLPEEAHQDR